MQRYYAHGKFLLTGEYFILNGATGLAVPLQLGQWMEVRPGTSSGVLHWLAQKQDGNIWLDFKFNLQDLSPWEAHPQAQKLSELLREARKLNPGFLAQDSGVEVATGLEFPGNWGLGSSSTLISLIAQWSATDAWTLLRRVWGGSGYDLACASSQGPLLYHLEDHQPVIEYVDLHYSFREHLYFAYLGQKQDSALAVKNFKTLAYAREDYHARIDHIAQELISCNQLAYFETLLQEHERLVAEVTGMPTVKSRLFPDLEGTVKSLGAWGGDFVMICWKNNEHLLRAYLHHKGIDVVLRWNEIVLSP